MGASDIILGFAGKSTYAIITDIRREGGERTDGKPGRYTYNISYTFTLPDGEEVNGFTKRIGDSVYLKADRTSTVRIRYYPAFPYINALEQDAGFGLRQLILTFAGGTLFFLINKKN
jgi:hypothetical protein